MRDQKPSDEDFRKSISVPNWEKEFGGEDINEAGIPIEEMSPVPLGDYPSRPSLPSAQLESRSMRDQKPNAEGSRKSISVPNWEKEIGGEDIETAGIPFEEMSPVPLGDYSLPKRNC